MAPHAATMMSRLSGLGLVAPQKPFSRNVPFSRCGRTLRFSSLLFCGLVSESWSRHADRDTVYCTTMDKKEKSDLFLPSLIERLAGWRLVHNDPADVSV